MRILLLCHYFAPEPGAPSARLSELGRAWVHAGHDVEVVTCFPNHPTGVVSPEFRGQLCSSEERDGMRVFRNWVYATPNEGVVKKTLGHLSFMISGPLFSLFRVKRPDVVVVSSPTFFSLFSGYLFSRLRGAPLVVEIRDLWPAAIVELGVLKSKAIIGFLEALEMWAYRKAAHVVVVTRSFKDNLVARGVPEAKISVVTNGVDLERFSPGPASAAVEEDLHCAGKSLVLYIGAFGISQGLATILEVANLLRDRDDIVFGLVGEGADREKLLQRAAELGLKNVRFLGAQPKDRMVEFYRTAAVCLVPLRNVPLFKTFIPSKMFEILASGSTIVASLEGEAEEILERSGGARVVAPEDAGAIARALLELVDNPELRRTLGRSGRDFVAANYSRTRLAETYATTLATIRKAGDGR
ncbi:MAG: glycosyltransferase family 4 protein [Armatimonadota bacterium]